MFNQKEINRLSGEIEAVRDDIVTLKTNIKNYKRINNNINKELDEVKKNLEVHQVVIGNLTAILEKLTK
jgi:predicted  nucleic acid-binding Zn-ribbon protein